MSIENLITKIITQSHHLDDGFYLVHDNQMSVVRYLSSDEITELKEHITKDEKLSNIMYIQYAYSHDDGTILLRFSNCKNKSDVRKKLIEQFPFSANSYSQYDAKANAKLREEDLSRVRDLYSQATWNTRENTAVYYWKVNSLNSEDSLKKLIRFLNDEAKIKCSYHIQTTVDHDQGRAYTSYTVQFNEPGAQDKVKALIQPSTPASGVSNILRVYETDDIDFALRKAAHAGDVDSMRNLVANGANVNAVSTQQNGSGKTALHFACSAQQLDAVRYLQSLEQCQKNIRDNSGKVPFEYLTDESKTGLYNDPNAQKGGLHVKYPPRK